MIVFFPYKVAIYLLKVNSILVSQLRQRVAHAVVLNIITTEMIFAYDCINLSLEHL